MCNWLGFASIYTKLCGSLTLKAFNPPQVAGQFELEVRVVGFSDPVDDCGFESCHLYIDDLCLKPQSEDQESEGADENCLLGKFSGYLDLEEGLPKTESFTWNTQPWPVSVLFRIYGVIS